MTRTALCIGINNYPGTQMDLQGCVNDAADWAEALGARGYAVERLIDSQATKAAIVAALQKLIGAAQAGDGLVVTYSGHGTYVPDVNGDEVDGLDEALCPHDIRSAGALVDDEIHALFAQRRPGVRLVLIADSCHSGTVTRAAGHDADAETSTRARFLPIGNWLPEARLPRGASGQPLAALAVTSGLSPLAAALSRREDDLLLAGCREGPNNFSYDAVIRGRPNGAFTYYALKTLKALPAGASYADWHAAITPALLPSASYPQTPQLVGSAAARRRKVFA